MKHDLDADGAGLDHPDAVSHHRLLGVCPDPLLEVLRSLGRISPTLTRKARAALRYTGTFDRKSKDDHLRPPARSFA